MNAVVLVMRELVRWLFCVFSEVNRLSVHPVRQTAGWGYVARVAVTVVCLSYLSFPFRNALIFVLRVLCLLLCVSINDWKDVCGVASDDLFQC